MLKVDYHINLFLQLDSAHTEKFSGIDNSDTSKLNEVTDIFGRLAIECCLGSSSDFYGIIGNKTVTTLDKLNCGFTLTDAAVARKQTAFAVHFNKNAVTGNSRSKLFVKILYK